MSDKTYTPYGFVTKVGGYRMPCSHETFDQFSVAAHYCQGVTLEYVPGEGIWLRGKDRQGGEDTVLVPSEHIVSIYFRTNEPAPTATKAK